MKEDTLKNIKESLRNIHDKNFKSVLNELLEKEEYLTDINKMGELFSFVLMELYSKESQLVIYHNNRVYESIEYFYRESLFPNLSGIINHAITASINIAKNNKEKLYKNTILPHNEIILEFINTPLKDKIAWKER